MHVKCCVKASIEYIKIKTTQSQIIAIDSSDSMLHLKIYSEFRTVEEEMKRLS